MDSRVSRRRFLQFMSAGTLAATAAGPAAADADAPRLTHLAPTTADALTLVPGLRADLLIAYGDPVNSRGETFGYDNDYIACLPGDHPDEAWLWVNHESIRPFLMHGAGTKRDATTRAVERAAVGGSILKLRRKDGRYQVAVDGSGRRIHADTPIPFKGGVQVAGSAVAKGTLANCAGGVTPWGTVLTCEENYYKFFGEVAFPEGKRTFLEKPIAYDWHKDDPRPPEHYGWVVEVDLRTGACAKLPGLGRLNHECATCAGGVDAPVVVYTGDDENDECLYKFIAAEAGSLEKGDLYVADLEHGRWILLDPERQPLLKGRFRDRIDMLVRTREAARLVGGTPLARPEDIEIHPVTGDVYVCLTNNDPKGDYHGSILRIRETGGKHDALTFSHDVFLTGGEAGGLSSPDNLVFDRRGNLWLTCDVSESKMNKGRYQAFGNNGLYYIPMQGPEAGKPVRVAAAPTDAEFTGPCFSPNGRTLFLSVQHPGARSKPGAFTSQWPDGPGNPPRPGVVQISGPLLDHLLA